MLPARVVGRPRLVEMLDVATHGRVTNVVAPAGYGKSVAVAQWRSSVEDRPIAWLDLHTADDDAIHFARTLAGALSEALGDLAPRLDLVDVGGWSLGVDLIDRLVADLTLVPDLVLVLDNFEVVRRAELVADIASLIERAPTSAHFVLISRSDPAIGLGRLRVRGELVELRSDALSMDAEEAAALMERTAQIELDDPTLERLIARTSGWPAALQLAALSMRHTPDPAAFVERFSGDDRHVAEYLTEEVLEACTPEERRFLIETSILDRLNGALCDAVTGRAGGHSVLRGFERSGMLLSRVDGPGDWYRYHPLLRDLLQTELEVGDPGRHRDVLLRAAAWHRAADDVETATAYLVKARAWDELLESTQVYGRTCFERGMSTMLRSRVEAMPDDVRLGSPLAALTVATLHLLTGQSHLADDELTRLEERAELSGWEQTVVDAERAAMVAWHLEPQSALDAGRRALGRMSTLVEDERTIDVLGITSPRSLEAVALVAMGRAAHYLGDDDEARELLIRAADRSEGAYLPWYLHSLGVRSTVEALSGELPTAIAFATRVLELASEAGIATHPATAEAQLAIAVVRREQNELTEANFALDQVMGLIRANHRWPLLRLHAVESAWLRFAGGEARGASALVSDGVAGDPSDRQPYAARMVAVAARSLLASGRTDDAASLLDRHAALRITDEVGFAAVALAVARRDTTLARRLLDERGVPSRPRSAVEHHLWGAVVDDLGGHRAQALQGLAAAVDLAAGRGLRRVFLDVGPQVLPLARAQHDRFPNAFLRSILGRQPEPPPSSSHAPGLVEQLTDREMAVLHYLPTRLSNAEIAGRLFVSVNTIKTHLKHIYRKLGVEDRSSAIERAEALQLLR